MSVCMSVFELIFFEWQFHIIWWSGHLVSQKQLWIAYIPLLYVHGSHLWQCCAFQVCESPENHRAVTSRPSFPFLHMVLNDGCKLPPITCGLWPDQTSDHTRISVVVHMPTPVQVPRALFVNISVHILSSSYSHSRQEPFLLLGPALVLLQHQQWLSLECPCWNKPAFWLQPTYL